MAKKVRQLRLQHECATAAAATAAAEAAATTAASEGSGNGEGTPNGTSTRGASTRGGAGAGAGAALEASMPEYVVPYAIHLLAHHPDFPVNKASRSRVSALEGVCVWVEVGGSGRLRERERELGAVFAVSDGSVKCSDPCLRLCAYSLFYQSMCIHWYESQGTAVKALLPIFFFGGFDPSTLLVPQSRLGDKPV